MHRYFGGDAGPWYDLQRKSAKGIVDSTDQLSVSLNCVAENCAFSNAPKSVEPDSRKGNHDREATASCNEFLSERSAWMLRRDRVLP
jgi:hypothetical protein